MLSNDAHAESWVEAFAHFDYKVRYDDVRQLIGMGGDKLMPKLVPGLDNESGVGKEISQFRTKLFLDRYAPKLQSAPGSRLLVEHMLQKSLKLMIASSAKEDELQTLLKAARVDDLLKEATTSSDADNSKPDPDIVHAALGKIGLPPQQVLMLGDTPYDIDAAGKAGVRLAAVRTGGWKDSELEGAIVIYDDCEDILAHYDDSPFALI